MTIGSLTSLPGSYTYLRRGTTEEFFPDLAPDRGGETGRIAFAKGSLPNPDPEQVVGWKLMSVYDVGIDVLIDLEQTCFIDRIVVVQDATQGGCAGIEVRASTDGTTFRAVGRSDTPDQDTVVVPVGVAASQLVVRLNACFNNIALKQLDIFGHTLDQPVLYPLPARIEYGSARAALPLAKVSAIVAGDDPAGDALFAAHLLSDKIAEDHGASIPVVKSTTTNQAPGTICIGLQGSMRALDDMASDLTPEGYSLVADKKNVRIAAIDRRGLIYGAETLLGLLRVSGTRARILACAIEDRPAMEFRGIHLGLPPRSEIPFIKRLIRHLLAPMRLNTIYFEIGGGMQFDRHPEINEAWVRENARAARGERPAVAHGNMVAGGKCLTKDEVRDLVEYATSYGFEVIPEVQSLSHVQYLTMAYPEIGEVEAKTTAADDVDIEKEDKKPDQIDPHCYCPSNEKSYEIVFDLIDEIVEVVKPSRYVHMGHDEVYVIGVCPRCKGTDPAELFARHVTRMHDYLAEKGLGMMIWSDMLQPCTRYKTPPAIDRIPKDIVMLDFIWYFHMDKDLEDNLLNRGFKVIMGNMYSSHFPRYETRRIKPGMIGAEVSTWVREDEYTFAREGKLYDLLYSANMMWSAAYREHLRLTYDRIVTDMLPRIRSRLHGRAFPSLDKACSFTPVPLPANHGGVAGILSQGKRRFRGVPFAIRKGMAVEGTAVRERTYPTENSVPIAQTFHSLLFLHAALTNAERIPWQALVPVAAYLIEYADAKTVKVPIEYGGNIAAIGRRHAEPLPHAMYRHEGYIGTYLADPFIQEKTPDGGDITVYGYEWINPRPNVTIRSVRLVAEGNTDVPVVLFALTGTRL